MSRSERTGTTLLAALGLVLGAIALWQPVGPIADLPGQRLVLAVPTWVQFVLLGATLVEFLAIVLVMIPNWLKKRPDGTLEKRPSAMRLSPIEKMALLLPLAAVAIAAYQSQYFESGRFGWLFGAGSRGGWFGSSADPPPDVVSVPLLDLSVSITLGIVAAVVVACSILAVLLVRPWVTIAEWLRQERVRRGARPLRTWHRRWRQPERRSAPRSPPAIPRQPALQCLSTRTASSLPLRCRAAGQPRL